MKLYAALLTALIFATPAFAAHSHTGDMKRAAVLMPGFGPVHHPVSTENRKAQAFLDQGLA